VLRGIARFEARSGDIDCRDVFLCPLTERFDWNAQRAPQRGQLVGNVGRYSGRDRALDKPVTFQAAQRQREHALRNSRDGPLEIVEPPRAELEQHDDQNAPLVADATQKFSHPIAVFCEVISPVLNHIDVPSVSTLCLLAAPVQAHIITAVMNQYRSAREK
jgi:hypothetical protein